MLNTFESTIYSDDWVYKKKASHQKCIELQNDKTSEFYLWIIKQK